MFTMSLGKHVRILFSGSFVKIKKRDDFLDVLDTLVMVLLRLTQKSLKRSSGLVLAERKHTRS